MDFAVPARVTGRLILGRDAVTLLSTELRARNFFALGHIGFETGHSRSAIPLSSAARLLRRGLALTFRDDRSGKIGTRDTRSYQDCSWLTQNTTGHIYRPAKPMSTWITMITIWSPDHSRSTDWTDDLVWFRLM